MSAFDQFQINNDNVTAQPGDAGPQLGPLRHLLLACLLYLLVFLSLFSPVLFSGQLLAPDDGFLQNLPNFFGPRTLWTLSIYSGYPLLADPLVQYFYPIPLLLCHLPQGWNIFVVSGYVLSGTFLYLYLRLLTGSPFAAWIGGLFYCLSGYLLCETLHMHVVQTAMWFAALLTIFEYFARDLRQASKAYLIGSLALCMCTLNGHFQTLAYLLGVLSLYAPCRALGLREKLGESKNRPRLKYLFVCYGILATGLLLSAMQLLPTAELAAFSARKLFTFQDFLTYDMHPLESLGLFFPFLFGGAPDGIISQPYFATFVCPPHFLYLGYIPLFLTAAALTAFSRNRLIYFWALAGILAFFLSFGDFTPLAYLLYHLPPFGSFRCLHRILLVTALANAILAGLAVAALEKGILPRKALIISTTALVLSFVEILLTLPTLQGLLAGQAIKYGIKSLGALPWTNPAIGCSTLLFALSLGALSAFARAPNKKHSKILLAAITICDLAFLGWYAQGGQWRLKSLTEAKLAAPASAQKYVPLAEQTFSRILTVRGGSATFDELPNNLCRLWQVPSASGYEPLMMSRYGNLLNISEGGFLIPPWQYTGEDRSFDILAIAFATSAPGDDRLEKIIDRQGKSAWHIVENTGTASIHENSRHLPRCWLVQAVQKMGEAEILKAIKSGLLPDGRIFDPEKLALAEEETGFTGEADAKDNSPGKIKIVVLTSDYIKIDATNEKSAILILSDIFYPWWKATVDGKPATIFRVDYVLRGLVLGAGHHTVEFKLQADSLQKGLVLSALASLLLAVGFVILGRKTSLPSGGQVGKSL
jgi:hypothetical protein